MKAKLWHQRIDMKYSVIVKRANGNITEDMLKDDAALARFISDLGTDDKVINCHTS